MSKYIIANWKQNMPLEAIKKWSDAYLALISKVETNNTVILCPSFPYLDFCSSVLPSIGLGAQTVSSAEKGSHTGEVGAEQLTDFCRYVIVGHSERKEPKEQVIAKRERCLSEGLIPIMCFVDPADVFDYYKEGVILAMEDPTNISKEGVYNPQDPEAVAGGINIVKSELPPTAIVVYGGSVNKQNAEKLSEITNLDGLLIGHASLDPEHFIEIIKTFS